MEHSSGSCRKLIKFYLTRRFRQDRCRGDECENRWSLVLAIRRRVQVYMRTVERCCSEIKLRKATQLLLCFYTYMSLFSAFRHLFNKLERKN